KRFHSPSRKSTTLASNFWIGYCSVIFLSRSTCHRRAGLGSSWPPGGVPNADRCSSLIFVHSGISRPPDSPEDSSLVLNIAFTRPSAAFASLLASGPMTVLSKSCSWCHQPHPNATLSGWGWWHQEQD